MLNGGASPRARWVPRSRGRALGEVESLLRTRPRPGSGTRPCLRRRGASGSARAARRRRRPGRRRGTDMGEGINAAVALRPQPSVVVVLTDGRTPWPDEALQRGRRGRDPRGRLRTERHASSRASGVGARPTHRAVAPQRSLPADRCAPGADLAQRCRPRLPGTSHGLVRPLATRGRWSRPHASVAVGRPLEKTAGQRHRGGVLNCIESPLRHESTRGR
jgi:hypothetical protein